MDQDQRTRRSLALLGAWVLGCGLAFWVIYHVSVRTTSGREFADASLRGAILSQARAAGLVDRALGVVTVASLAAAVAVIATIALVRLRRGLGLAAVGLLVMSNLSAQLLKTVLPRPDLGLREYAPATLNSLPGGHSTAAFSVVVALLLVVPARLRRPVALTGGAYACVVSAATMAAGWHRPGDSVAAFLLVGLWAGVAMAGVVAFDAGELDELPGSATGAAVQRSLVVVAALCLGVSSTMMATLMVATSLRETTLGEAASFVTGVLFLVGVAIVVIESLLAIIERVAPGRARVPAAG